MHNAQAYVESLAALSGSSLSTGHASLVLNLTQASSLSKALRQDAEDYLFSAWITFGDCIHGLQDNFFSWASVKAYYATFYAARAYLAATGHGIVYVGTKPKSISCRAGGTIIKANGTTHDAVFRLFAGQHPSHVLLSQTIDMVQPFEWLKARREDANYRNSRFCEPSAPRHFLKICLAGIRASLDAYASDSSYLYTFDADHAILAFPLAFIHEAQSLLKSSGKLDLPEGDKRFLLSTLQDRKGPYPKVRDRCNSDFSIKQ
jgi:hypothetical protein